MPEAHWLTTDAFARLRRVTRRRAQQQLAAWESTSPAPRTRRVQGPHGRPALQVAAEDVAALYAVDIADVHLLAA